MEKKDMIQALIGHYSEGNKTHFAAILGVKPQTINSWISRNTFDNELIYAKCVGVSADWLMTGQGDMLCKDFNKESLSETVNQPQPQAEASSSIIQNFITTIQEQAEEIGRLREQVRQLKIERGKDASDAITSTSANVG